MVSREKRNITGAIACEKCQYAETGFCLTFPEGTGIKCRTCSLQYISNSCYLLSRKCYNCDIVGKKVFTVRLLFTKLSRPKRMQ